MQWSSEYQYSRYNLMGVDPQFPPTATPVAQPSNNPVTIVYPQHPLLSKIAVGFAGLITILQAVAAVLTALKGIP